MSDAREPEPPACLACGTCCFSDLVEYVRVTGDDYARLGDDAERVTSWVGTRCSMTMHKGHCAALVVDRAKREFVCSVYERRPAICRELARGGSECRGELATKGARSLRVMDS